jgi:hypothetical protein
VSATTWSKFFWSDWESDEALKMCSPAAQALWMRMLCICAKTDGYLMIRGNVLTASDMATHTGWPLDQVMAWWAELSKWEVFSVDGRGRTYCRRMVKAAKKAQTARENGKNGGNPSLRKGEEKRALDNQNPTNPSGSTPYAISQIVSEAIASSSPEGDGAQVPTKYPEPFETAWKAYPHVKGRSSKSKSLAAWRRLPAVVRTQLPAAIARYAREGREPRAECGARAMERWIRDALYEDWLADPPKGGELNRAQRLQHFAETGRWRDEWGPRPEIAA